MSKILRWYYGSASIRKKLVISYIILITIPIMVLGIYSFTISRKNMEEQTRITMKNNIDLMISELETTLQRENDNIRYLSYNTKFRQTLKNSAGSTVDIARVLNEVVEPIFWYFITSDTNLKMIEIYSPYVEDKVGNFLRPVEHCLDEPWFSYHMSHYDTLWTYENGVMFATRTLLDAPTSSEPIGILKMSVYPNSILEPIQKTDYLNNGILIMDSSDQVIYWKKSGYEKIDLKVRNSAEDVSGGIEADYPEYLLMTGQIDTSGWQIYYYVAKDMISGQLREMIRSTLMVVGICLILIVFMIGILSKVLSRRILDLKESAEQVAEGNFDLAVSTGYRDEIGAVAKSLQMMNDRLKEMITRVYKAELEKKAMELKALQAMINPHFLYNCLSSIKWKAIKSGNDEISELTGHLAKFYRTSLNGGQQITRVGAELENIKSYIELERRTHDNQFMVEYHIQEEELDYPMPNFLIQPIVENAIEHGINYKDGQAGLGLLMIRYETDDEYLYFHIINNGPPIEINHLDEILNTPGKGYGIFNIRERIRIYYGDLCGLSVRITGEGYTCFTVTLRKDLKEMA